MIPLASIPAPDVKSLARSALTVLGSREFMKESRIHLPEASTAALDILRDWAKGDEEGADHDLAPHALLPDHPLEIAIHDWDIMVRAVKARLLVSVGERLAAAPGPQVHDAAELVKSIVLECVTALNQLHTALTHERGQHALDLFDAQASQASEKDECPGTASLVTASL